MPSALDPRPTERRNPRTVDIDLASPLQIVDLMNAEDRTIADAVATQREQVARTIEMVEATIRAGGRLFYMGAGTSGRLGVLDASECPPTFGSDPETVQGIIAGGEKALTRATEGAEDLVEGAKADLEEAEVTGKDFVLGIAASGTTTYVCAGIEHAKSLGARTGILACSPPSAAVLKHADIAIVVITGPEVLTGSTRLKAGTATKMVLNMITTGAMIRLGKAYGNLMVDLRATNAKLRDRSERLVKEICDVDRANAKDLLTQCDGHVKVAILMSKLGIKRKEAEARLDTAKGIIRDVISGSPPPVPGA
jgi:N-acetylmuramic acid 6-phosphate etherase